MEPGEFGACVQVGDPRCNTSGDGNFNGNAVGDRRCDLRTEWVERYQGSLYEVGFTFSEKTEKLGFANRRRLKEITKGWVTTYLYIDISVFYSAKNVAPRWFHVAFKTL